MSLGLVYFNYYIIVNSHVPFVLFAMTVNIFYLMMLNKESSALIKKKNNGIHPFKDGLIKTLNLRFELHHNFILTACKLHFRLLAMPSPRL